MWLEPVSLAIIFTALSCMLPTVSSYWAPLQTASRGHYSSTATSQHGHSNLHPPVIFACCSVRDTHKSVSPTCVLTTEEPWADSEAQTCYDNIGTPIFPHSHVLMLTISVICSWDMTEDLRLISN